jgi:CheY-like chemotaxis protein/AraC-like DNA-binding protein
MPSLLIVDDEPQARHYLKALVERHCPEFSVVAEAEGGEETLELARRALPDVVATDVRMPGMDGLELARRLQSELPSIAVVVVSGYEEFEYARSAIKAGVVDYLLKPVKAEQLKAVLGEVASRAAVGLYARRSRALRGIVAGSDAREAGCLPGGRYSAAVLRFGPPPSRFPASDAVSGTALEAAARAEAGLEALHVWALGGRDDRERLFVRSSSLTDGGDFERAVLAVAEGSDVAYRVLAFGSDLFGLAELGGRVGALYRLIDASVVPGKTLVMRGLPEARAADHAREAISSSPLDLSAIEGRVEYLIAESRYAELERVLRELIASWSKESRPLVQSASQLRRLFDLVRHRSGSEARMRDDEPDALSEEATTAAADYADLADRAIEALAIIACPPARSGGNEDVPAFFASIKRYIEDNFAYDLSLQSTCRVFSISQTYLSRLFRKHEGLSFNDYLTRSRIEAAKRLIAENPTMPLKDVASLAGYQDQFYFSRVFKAIVGLPPSEYAFSLRPRLD